METILHDGRPPRWSPSPPSPPPPKKKTGRPRSGTHPTIPGQNRRPDLHPTPAGAGTRREDGGGRGERGRPGGAEAGGRVVKSAGKDQGRASESEPGMEGRPETGREDELTRQLFPEEGPYERSRCQRRFQATSEPVCRQRPRRGGKTLGCRERGKEFGQSSAPSSHWKSHVVEKSYWCSTCQKLFQDGSTLLRHERAHTGEKPYACRECGKSFSQRSNLFTHRVVRTGEKPFACHRCGKRFTQRRSSLIVHQRGHGRRRTGGCSKCGKSLEEDAGADAPGSVGLGDGSSLCCQCAKTLQEASGLLDRQR